jgi:Rod binding domain-containing protein
MSAFSLPALPVDLLRPGVNAPSAGVVGDKSGKVAAIAKTAKDFEASFLSNMLGQMFEGLSTDGPFGGGQGEAMFRSVMMDTFGKQIVKAGGVGVAAAVQREMLKMQGLA